MPSWKLAVSRLCRARPDRRPSGLCIDRLRTQGRDAGAIASRSGRHPDGPGRFAFCARYRAWKKARGSSCGRRTSRATSCLSNDYPATRRSMSMQRQASASAASCLSRHWGPSYTFAEATHTEDARFSGQPGASAALFRWVPAAIVSDQLRSGIVAPCRYEPGPTRRIPTSRRTGTALVPARLCPVRATRPRWKSRCRWRSAGFWRGLQRRLHQPG